MEARIVELEAEVEKMKALNVGLWEDNSTLMKRTDNLRASLKRFMFKVVVNDHLLLTMDMDREAYLEHLLNMCELPLLERRKRMREGL